MAEKGKPAVWLVLPVLHRGGAERVVAELAKGLPRHGFATTVCCLEDETAPVGKELNALGIPVLGLGRDRRNTFACGRALARRLTEERPRIVHAHLFHANLAARVALATIALRNAEYRPLVLSTIHVQEQRFRPWQFALDRGTARWCQCEICVSPSVERFHRQETGLPKDFFKVIGNGVDLERFRLHDPEERQLIREQLGLGSQQRLVLAAGRLDPQKDQASLLEAWGRLQPAQAELWIAGEGPERRRLEAMLPPGARLLGFRDDLPRLLAACDLFVQPSAWEGQPLTILEAMASGCPILASDIESHQDLIQGGFSGELVPQGVVEAWEAALARLLAETSLARDLGATAARVARSRHGLEGMIRAYARLYGQFLDGK